MAVTVAWPPPASYIGLPLRLKLTEGGESLSIMVRVWVVIEPKLALIGFDRVTRMVSLGSFKASSTMSMEMLRVVTPGAKLRVPGSTVSIGSKPPRPRYA